MKKFDVIFILLNYNTTKDLECFIKTTNRVLSDIKYKFICVDNYSNQINLEKLSYLKTIYDFELIKNQNTGYGDGNNVGIEYAIEHYDFDYLIVSNCDIEIMHLTLPLLNKYKKGIIAPDIINRAGKKQNPMYLKKHPIIFYLFYQANIRNSMFFQRITIVLSKILRMFDSVFINKDNQIFCCHGSFIIFPKEVLMEILPVFSKDIFLLCEEIDLAMKLEKKKVPIFYQDAIKIKHFEDASMGDYDRQEKVFKLWQRSYSIFYKNHFDH